MAWPKGKPRGKKNKFLGAVCKTKEGKFFAVNENNIPINGEKVIEKLEAAKNLNLKVNEVRGMIGLPDTKVYIDQHKVYFISLINEKIISFKISE